jgi:hypothetical protein
MFVNRYQMISSAGNISLIFSSHALSSPVLTLLESDPVTAAAVSTELVHNGWLIRPSVHTVDPTNASSSGVHAFFTRLTEITKSPNCLDSLLAVGATSAMTNMLMLSPTASIDILRHPISTHTPPSEATDALDDAAVGETKKEEIVASISFAKRALVQGRDASNNGDTSNEAAGRLLDAVWSRLHSSVVAGFQSTCVSGPLMQEPLHGVVFTVDTVRVCISCIHWLIYSMLTFEIGVAGNDWCLSNLCCWG